MPHGGRRPGAGRKPKNFKEIMAQLKRPSRESALLILEAIKANERWIMLANCKDKRLVFDVMRYLTDRAFGKAKQAIEHLLPGTYQQMTDAELEAYALRGELPAKLNAADYRTEALPQLIEAQS